MGSRTLSLADSPINSAGSIIIYFFLGQPPRMHFYRRLLRQRPGWSWLPRRPLRDEAMTAAIKCGPLVILIVGPVCLQDLDLDILTVAPGDIVVLSTLEKCFVHDCAVTDRVVDPLRGRRRPLGRRVRGLRGLAGLDPSNVLSGDEYRTAGPGRIRIPPSSRYYSSVNVLVAFYGDAARRGAVTFLTYSLLHNFRATEALDGLEIIEH